MFGVPCKNFPPLNLRSGKKTYQSGLTERAAVRSFRLTPPCALRNDLHVLYYFVMAKGQSVLTRRDVGVIELAWDEGGNFQSLSENSGWGGEVCFDHCFLFEPKK